MTHSNDSNSVIRGTSIVSLLTLLSRILGFVRDLLVARLFGASAYADAFFVAFRIPNLLRSFVAEGALVSAFVPVFSAELKAGQTQAQVALRSVSGLLILLSGSLTALGIFFAPEIVHLFAPGFTSDPDKFDLCVDLTQIMLPYLMCVSFIAMLNGALNAVKVFGAAAWAQVIMNIVLIIGAWVAAYFDSRTAAYCLAWSVLAGGVVQLISQIPALKRANFSLWPSRRPFTAVTKRLLILMGPAVIGATVYQISIFLNTLLASLLEPGSVSWLFYADRVTQFPIGIFSVSLASVLLPVLANANAADRHMDFGKNISDSLRYTSFAIIPMSAFIFFFSLPIVELLFERGAFLARDSQKTSLAVQAMALGLWAVSCYSMIVRAFIAKHDTLTATLIGLVSLVVNLGLALMLMGPLVTQSETSWLSGFISLLQSWLGSILPQFKFGHAGLGLASSLAAFVSLALIFIYFDKKFGGVSWKAWIRSTWQATVSSAISLGILWFVLPPGWAPIYTVCFGLLGYGLLYIIVAYLLRSLEIKETFGAIRRFL